MTVFLNCDTNKNCFLLLGSRIYILAHILLTQHFNKPLNDFHSNPIRHKLIFFNFAFMHSNDNLTCQSSFYDPTHFCEEDSKIFRGNLYYHLLYHRIARTISSNITAIFSYYFKDAVTKPYKSHTHRYIVFGLIPFQVSTVKIKPPINEKIKIINNSHIAIS